MTTIIITAIIAFDFGIVLGAWWGGRERDRTDQEYLDDIEKRRARATARRMMEGL